MTIAMAGPRPLTRSLEPLGGESLAGYLLRLSCRLHVSPPQLARLAGCAVAGPGVIARRLLLDLDVPRFALATRLSAEEASALTIASWAGRYPPVTRSRTGQGPPVILDNWLFSVTPRFCPDCLAGDGSLIQQQYGHRRSLSACPQQHPARPGIGMLITCPAATALPTQEDDMGLDFEGVDPDNPHDKCPAVFVDPETGDFYFQGDTVMPQRLLSERQQRQVNAGRMVTGQLREVRMNTELLHLRYIVAVAVGVPVV